MILFFDNDEESCLFLKVTHIKATVQNHTLFMTKIFQNQLKLILYLWPEQPKTIPFEVAHTHMAHIREYPALAPGSKKSVIVRENRAVPKDRSWQLTFYLFTA